MKFIDEITLFATAGTGGDGVVRWIQARGMPRGGPGGGDGGRGGDVYARAIRDIAKLAQYRSDPKFRAEDGEPGQNHRKHGKDGESIYIELPIGSRVTNKTTEESFELLHEGEEVLVLRGGPGGFGNEHFKSSRNVKPTKATKGKEGEEAELYVELSLIADAGLIGLPNAGKSSLLNELTSAKAKVGSYQFTTLDPNLGDFYGFILADIPGLIEGASEGKGLGHKFLKHITRTKLLLHCVSLESSDPLADYRTIRKELTAYNEALGELPEIVVLTKTDLVPEEEQSRLKDLFREEIGEDVFTVSILDNESIKSFSDSLASILASA
ncbi:MAG: GTPase ObgE [Candidatus Pacebacteria bacterium]|nr:GTPase ObgE [Candidatus Paceibacterota bacterium]